MPVTHAHPFKRNHTVPNSTSEPITVVSYHATWTGITEPTAINTPNYLGHKVEYTCDVPCLVTRDQSYITRADAILWEVQPLTGFTDKFRRVPVEFPEKLVNQLWMNIGYETPEYFPLYGEPAFTRHIDVNMTYQQDSPVPITFTCDWGGGNGLEEYKKPPTFKSKGIAAMLTNCVGGGAVHRTAYVKELMNYLEIDSFGVFLCEILWRD